MPTVEQFANNVSTTLNGAILLGATSLVVTSATGFPAVGNFRILIDSEIFLCTSRAGTTCTVVPGSEGTTQAAHSTLAAVTLIVTAGALQTLQNAQVAPVTFTRATNAANATYTIDVTGGAADYLILHNKSGAVSYVMPTPTDGREIRVRDITGAVQTLANNVFFVPHAAEKFNTSAGFALTGTAYHFTNASATVTATGSKFTSELAVGMSVVSSNQAGVSYIVSVIGSDTSLTLSTTFTGTTTVVATATRNSLTFAANFGELVILSDGTDWFVKGNGVFTKVSFTASGTFIPPAGTTGGQLIGCGQGGGGGGGDGPTAGTTAGGGGGGGGGGTERTVQVSWTPNTSIAVVIGSSANGGSAFAQTPGTTGTGGTATTFGGTTAVFLGGAGGQGSQSQLGGNGGLSFSGQGLASTSTQDVSTNGSASYSANGAVGGAGGVGVAGGSGTNGNKNEVGGFAGGSAGGAGTFTTTGGSGGGGGGGGAGPRGAGGNAGLGGNGEASVGAAGGSAGAAVGGAANTGAGGGGGGGGGASTGTPGTPTAGGAGGSGYLDVIYVL